jgi:ceramide glucosyltransferase
VANGLAGADAVSFVPVVFGMRGFWSRLGGLLFDTEAVLAVLIGRGHVVTGSTVGIRREALAKVGGYRAVADRIAEDVSMGELLKGAGFRLALARRAARLYAPGGGFRETAGQAVRWARTVRSTAPAIYAMVLPLSTAPLLLLLSGGTVALLMLALHTLVRATVATLVDLRFCWDRSLVRALPLLPLLWVLEPLNLLMGLSGSVVDWRGRLYRVRGGRATLLRG